MNSAHELRRLIEALRELGNISGTDMAMATLTRTHGSTFRRPATRMLVRRDKSVVCELSGGCPQHDIVMRALDVMDSGVPRLIHYNAESGLDVLMEMGCGGELEVLLEPLSSNAATAFVEPLDVCLNERRHGFLATWFATNGAAIMPRRMLCCDGAVRYNGLDDEALSQRVLEEIDRQRQPGQGRQVITLTLLHQGDDVDLLVEPIAPPHALIVIGNSAAARALLPLSLALGWQTRWVDVDPQRMQTAEDWSGYVEKICATPGEITAALALDKYSSVVVMTHSLERDTAYLAALRQIPLAYLGTLGSRERITRIRTDERLAAMHLHAPAGLDIGSETPEEIALAVAAEIMAVINGRSGGPLRDNIGAIH